MPCVSGRFGPAGLILQVAIFADEGALQALNQPATEGSEPTALRLYDALIDTGATATCLKPNVISDANLFPVGKCQMISASHVVEVNQYRFVVGLPMGMQQQPNGLMAGNFSLFGGITGLEFSGSAGTGYDILVGMDILGRGSLKMDFDGHFSFCF